MNRRQGSKSEFNLRRPPPLTNIHEHIENEQESSIRAGENDSEEHEVSIIPIEYERDEGEASARRKVMQKSMSNQSKT